MLLKFLQTYFELMSTYSLINSVIKSHRQAFLTAIIPDKRINLFYRTCNPQQHGLVPGPGAMKQACAALHSGFHHPTGLHFQHRYQLFYARGIHFGMYL